MQHDLSLKCDLRDIINILFFAIFICISTETSAHRLAESVRG